MKSDRVAGGALIAGSIGFVVAMAIHPTGGGYEKIIGEAALVVGVHAFAITALCVQLFGFFRLTGVMRLVHPFADGAFIVFAIGAMAGVLAATVSGILTPMLARRAVEAGPEQLAVWQVLSIYNFSLNAALTQVFIGAAAMAMLIWSFSFLGQAIRWNYAAIAGILLGSLSFLALTTGHIRNNVHHVGLFVLCFAAWAVTVGVMISLSQADGEDPPCVTSDAVA